MWLCCVAAAAAAAATSGVMSVCCMLCCSCCCLPVRPSTGLLLHCQLHLQRHAGVSYEAGEAGGRLAFLVLLTHLCCWGW